MKKLLPLFLILFTIGRTEGKDWWTEVWDTESSDIKTYSPVCD